MLKSYLKKVYPAYLIAILVNFLILSPGFSVWKYFFFLQGIGLKYPSWFLESWSISIISWYYILTFGLLHLLSFITGMGFQKLCVVVTSFIFLGSLALKVWLLIGFDVDYRLGVRLISWARVDCVSTGFLVAWLCTRFPLEKKSVRWGLFFGGGLAILATFLLFLRAPFQEPLPVFVILVLPALGYSLLLSASVYGKLTSMGAVQKGLVALLLPLVGWTVTRSIFIYLTQIPVLWCFWRWNLLIQSESGAMRFFVWLTYLSIVLSISEIGFRLDRTFSPRSFPKRKAVPA
ncbi:MAG: hypothetical protein K2X47_07610 [Bdellovibrionales bacterium]|nr:hypothetical protein [Bdellovibrionales bacterium]